MYENQENPAEETHSTPRWVKVFGVIALLLVLVFVLMLLFGGGNHGPGRHRQSGDVGARVTPGSERG